MDSFLQQLKTFWKDRLCGKYTIFGAFMLYMVFFQPSILSNFITFLFESAGKDLIHNIVNDTEFIKGLAMFIGAHFIWKKEK